MKYKANYIFNAVCTIAFAVIAGYEITEGRMWQSLLFFFDAFLSVALSFFLQNEEKIEKLDEIEKLLKNKDDYDSKTII